MAQQRPAGTRIVTLNGGPRDGQQHQMAADFHRDTQFLGTRTYDPDTDLRAIEILTYRESAGDPNVYEWKPWPACGLVRFVGGPNNGLTMQHLITDDGPLWIEQHTDYPQIECALYMKEPDDAVYSYVRTETFTIGAKRKGL